MEGAAKGGMHLSLEVVDSSEAGMEATDSRVSAEWGPEKAARGC